VLLQRLLHRSLLLHLRLLHLSAARRDGVGEHVGVSRGLLEAWGLGHGWVFWNVKSVKKKSE
jgi:hypothetical protein